MKKVLIIEDDQIVANIYRNRFATEGYRMEIAADGHAGMEMVHSFKPDAVILDLMLPKLSGVDLIKKVRAEPEFEKLPIIVFSNTYLTNMVQEAWKAGATKCLSKASCSPKDLITVIQGLIGNATFEAANGQPTPDPASTAKDTADDLSASEQNRLFLESIPTLITTLRKLLQGAIKSANEPNRLKCLDEMYRHIRPLTSNASSAGMLPAAKISDALEALLKELLEKPANINASTLRTVASAIDLVGFLLERRGHYDKREVATANILVVDDEAISRRAVTYALEKAKLKAVSVDHPQKAYDLLCGSRFDLVFLDVDMPGMNGYELCTKLRSLPEYKTIPVVFVTGLNDFESRAHSMMSGGNDFIAKPFLFIELAVKALVHVLRGRLQRARPA